jgi:hypothetical protein
MFGATSGFLKSPWNDAPDIDKPAPTNMAAISLGNLTWKMTISTLEDHVHGIGKILDAKTFMTVNGDIGYLPKKKDMKKRAITATIEIIIIEIVGNCQRGFFIIFSLPLKIQDIIVMQILFRFFIA